MLTESWVFILLYIFHTCNAISYISYIFQNNFLHILYIFLLGIYRDIALTFRALSTENILWIENPFSDKF